MPTHAKCECARTVWKGRAGWRLSNGIVELVTLSGGGHIASIRRIATNSPNLLWEAPWKTIDPTRFRAASHNNIYSAPPAGPFLSGYTGHALVLGYFGGPSEAEAAAGLPIHGEAASRKWQTVSHRATRDFATLTLEIREPAMQLKFVRELTVRAGESLVHIRERVSNERKSDTVFQWVQHATFGEPLLSPATSRITMPAVRGCTWPLGYEGKSLLIDDKSFHWPAAPMKSGGTADLSRAFVSEGTGFVAAALIDAARTHGFIAVANASIALCAGYWFPRAAFPWVTIWEENRAREYAPWNGHTRARGLEFGTTPFPLGLADAINHGPMFDTPTVMILGARETKSVEYVAFASELRNHWQIEDIGVSGTALELVGRESRQRLRLGEVSQGSR